MRAKGEQIAIGTHARAILRSLRWAPARYCRARKKLGEAARILKQKETVKDFRDYLKAQTDDFGFERDFSNHVERRSKVQYYILRKLEIFLFGDGKGVVPGDHHSALNHIEHVLPQKAVKGQRPYARVGLGARQP